MKAYLQYRTRTLLAGTAGIAIALAFLVIPILNKHRQIARIRDLDINVETQAQIPSWLPNFGGVQDWFVVPTQARILVEPAPEGLKVFGNVYSLRDAQREAELRLSDIRTMNASTEIVFVDCGGNAIFDYELRILAQAVKLPVSHLKKGDRVFASKR